MHEWNPQPDFIEQTLNKFSETRLSETAPGLFSILSMSYPRTIPLEDYFKHALFLYFLFGGWMKRTCGLGLSASDKAAFWDGTRLFTV